MLSLQKNIAFTVAFLAFVFALNSCSGTQKAISADNLLLGTWKLSSAIIEGTDVDAEMLGGEVLFVFSAKGLATYTLPNGVAESNRFDVKDNRIYNTDKVFDCSLANFRWMRAKQSQDLGLLDTPCQPKYLCCGHKVLASLLQNVLLIHTFICRHLINLLLFIIYYFVLI